MRNQHEPFGSSKSNHVPSLLHPTKPPKSELIIEAGVDLQNTLLDSDRRRKISQY